MHNAIYYFAAVVVANLGFTYLPMIPLPGGEMFAPMSLLVGFIFVLRDYAQRELEAQGMGPHDRRHCGQLHPRRSFCRAR